MGKIVIGKLVWHWRTSKRGCRLLGGFNLWGKG